MCRQVSMQLRGGRSADDDAAVKQFAVLSMCSSKVAAGYLCGTPFEIELLSKVSHAQIAREEFAHGLLSSAEVA